MLPTKYLKDYFFKRIFCFLFFFFQPVKLSSEHIEIVNAPGCESDGEGYVSNHCNLSIFTFTAPMSLTVCLPWQRLFSDQLWVASASVPSLCSAHSGYIPACCQPNRPVLVAEKEGWMEKEGRRQRTSGKKKFPGVSMTKTFDELKLLSNCMELSCYVWANL